MTTVDDLAAWLAQILDEDEAMAKAAESGYPGRRWRFDGSSSLGPRLIVGPDEDDVWVGEISDVVWNCDDELDGCPDEAREWSAQGRHLARHNPAAVLARIAADRQILTLHGMTRIGWNKGWVDPTMHQREYCGICDHGRDDDSAYPSQSSYPCQTVRLLALPYADRPGYQEAWKPEA